jgi:hypothetical protein
MSLLLLVVVGDVVVVEGVVSSGDFGLVCFIFLLYSMRNLVVMFAGLGLAMCAFLLIGLMRIRSCTNT